MKTISELDRKEKVRLLKLVQAGEVDKSQIKPDSVIVDDPQEAFLELMKCSTIPDGEEIPVILIGKAKTEIEKLFNSAASNENT